MWAEIYKKEILSTQLGISTAAEDFDDVKTFNLRTKKLIDRLYKPSYNRYFLQREIQRVNNITRTEALTPHDTSTLDKTERVPFVITYNPSLRSISSIIHKRFHILISSPRCYNVFKAAPIVDYRHSSNLSDFLVRAKLRNLTQHNQPRGSYPCGKTVSLENTYLTDKPHTNSTLKAKPNLSLFLTVTFSIQKRHVKRDLRT